MKPQIETLRFFADRGHRGGTVRDVAQALGISDRAAAGRLARLWLGAGARLIAPVTLREPREHSWSLEAGERIEELRFQITPRGRERLEWARKVERKAAGWFFGGGR